MKTKSMEEWLDLSSLKQPVMCRGTFARAVAAYANSPYGLAGHDPAGSGSVSAGPSWSYQQAMGLLGIWEYIRRVHRGYFVEGMSGVQFTRGEEHEGITAALKTPEDEVIWLGAWDPAQIWGKALVQPEGRDFLNVPGTTAGLRSGHIAAAIERQGKVPRVFETEVLEQILKEFIKGFQEKALFPELKRLILKEYPKEFGDVLRGAGFVKEVNDYVLYR